jgi:hypothetical protein
VRSRLRVVLVAMLLCLAVAAALLGTSEGPRQWNVRGSVTIIDARTGSVFSVTCVGNSTQCVATTARHSRCLTVTLNSTTGSVSGLRDEHCDKRPSTGVQTSSRRMQAVLVDEHKSTVRGTFVASVPTGLHDMKLSGTIRFVTDHGRRTYKTRAIRGHWKALLPPGDYVVEGRSEQISGGRHWSQPTRLFVRRGRVKSTVVVMYETVR